MKNSKFSKDVYALVLAGGSGIRFWPLSQESKPKQFLKIIGRDSLLVSTINRIKKVIPKNQIYIIANEKQKDALSKEILKFRFPVSNVLLEPQAKNTAPAISWAAVEILKHNSNAVMVIFPCDHYIDNLAAFYKDLEQAVNIAKEGRLVVFGVKPTRAETGYGYIKIKNKKLNIKNYYEINNFIEKPNLTKAEEFFRNKNYFWNSGIFAWKAEVILKEIKLHQPYLFQVLNKIKDKKTLNTFWQSIKPISIDAAVLEKSKNIVMVPAHFKWNDLGGWNTYSEFLKKDKEGNHFTGDCKDFGSRNIDVINLDKPIRTLGLKDLIIVNAKDGLLISHKDKTQDIKKIIGG